MARNTENPWQKFVESPEPLVRVREVKKALPAGPGLPALYKEAKEHGTVLGCEVLQLGRNIYLRRRAIIDAVEGRHGQTEV